MITRIHRIRTGKAIPARFYAALILLACQVTISGCETELNIDYPTEPEKLVVNSVFNADSVLVVNLTKSRSLAGKRNAYSNVENADIRVFINDTQAGKLSYVSQGNYRTASVLSNQAKAKYSLEISAPGFETSRASGTLPSRPVVGKVEFDLDRGSSNIERVYDVTMSLADQAEENFYEVRIYDHTDKNTIQHWVRLDLNEFDQVNTAFGTVRFFDDKLFNGKQIDLKFSFRFYNINAQDRKISVVLKSISKEYYDYQFSVRRYFDSDPIISPSQPVKSNIENGLGVFGMYNAWVTTVTLR